MEAIVITVHVASAEGGNSRSLRTGRPIKAIIMSIADKGLGSYTAVLAMHGQVLSVLSVSAVGLSPVRQNPVAKQESRKLPADQRAGLLPISRLAIIFVRVARLL
jgi:hypothetical protein